MEETRTLQMLFINALGNTVTISITDPRDDIAPNEVQAVMNQIVAANLFTSSGGDLIAIKSARIINRQTTDLVFE